MVAAALLNTDFVLESVLLAVAAGPAHSSSLHTAVVSYCYCAATAVVLRLLLLHQATKRACRPHCLYLRRAVAYVACVSVAAGPAALRKSTFAAVRSSAALLDPSLLLLLLVLL